MIDEERRYLIWLCSLPGIYRDEQTILLKYFETPRNIYEAKDEEFNAWLNLGSPWVPALLKARRETDLDRACKKVEEGTVHFVSETDADYPKKLENLADRPRGLFYKGALPDPKVPCIAVIGARSCSTYGAGMARQIAEVIASYGLSVVSGMAAGVDGIAQRRCIESGMPSFGILGCGVDVCYPASNIDLYESLKNFGGIISEYGCGNAPVGPNFPRRNRIISGLADLVIVVEARKRSGTLITADCALEQGRDVLTVPGRTDDVLSAGCNHLIAQGAGIIESCEALEQILKDRFRKKKRKRVAQVSLAPEEKLVYSNLDLLPKSVEVLSEATGLPPVTVMVACMNLQMKDLVAEAGRNHFVRKQ